MRDQKKKGKKNSKSRLMGLFAALQRGAKDQKIRGSNRFFCCTAV
jgi:hypothetical protein